MIYLIFLITLAVTIAVECLAIAYIYRRWHYVYAAFLMNLLTNPLLNLLLLLFVWCCGTAAYGITLFVLEIAVWLVEAYILYYMCRLSRNKALVTSFLLNLLSYGCGLLLDWSWLPL